MLKISGSLSKLECFQSLPNHQHWLQWENSRRKGLLSRRQVALAKLSLDTKIRRIDIKYYIKIVRRLHSSSSRGLKFNKDFKPEIKLRVNTCAYTEKQSSNFSFSPSPLISGWNVCCHSSAKGSKTNSLQSIVKSLPLSCGSVTSGSVLLIWISMLMQP